MTINGIKYKGRVFNLIVEHSKVEIFESMGPNGKNLLQHRLQTFTRNPPTEADPYGNEFYNSKFAERVALDSQVFLGVNGSFLFEALGMLNLDKEET